MEQETQKTEVRSADEIKREKQKQARNLRRKMLNEMYRDLGLVKVKGARGGTYWE